MASAALLLHPVRLRIVHAFLGDRTLTVAQLATELEDVSPASIYRHVALLTKAGVLQVVAERRVRAVVERTYMLRVHAAQIRADEAAAMTPEQHLAAFTAYAAGMLAEVERYLMTGTADPLRDGAGYRMSAMWLSDAEVADFVRDLAAVFQPRLANPPAKGRRRRIFYHVLVPAPEPAPEAAGKPAKRAKRATSTTQRASSTKKPATSAKPRATKAATSTTPRATSKQRATSTKKAATKGRPSSAGPGRRQRRAP